MTFFPLYALGLLGMPRRMVSYSEPAYVPWTIVAEVGVAFILLAGISQVIQLIVSIRRRKQNAVPIGDPWDGRTLEWATPCPVPEYNFPVIPSVTSRDAFWHEKVQGNAYQRPARYEDIVMPKNSALGFILAVTGFLLAFGLTWYMWWLVIASSAATVIAMIMRGFVRETTKIIPAKDVQEEHEKWLKLASQYEPVERDKEHSSENMGLPLTPKEGDSDECIKQYHLPSSRPQPG